MKPKTTKMNLYYFLAIACTVGTMVFTYLAAKQDSQETENKLNETIKEQSTEIKRLSSQNIELSNIIFKNTQQITGNGSYPCASVGGGQDNGNKTQIVINLVGEYALPNLTANVVVIPDYSNVSGLDFRVTGIGNAPMDLGTIRKSEMKYFMVDTKTKETAVTIYFKTDNDSWTESIRIVKTEKGRKVFWYIKDREGKSLQKNIEDGFPTNENGEVIIWSNSVKKFAEI